MAKTNFKPIMAQITAISIINAILIYIGIALFFIHVEKLPPSLDPSLTTIVGIVFLAIGCTAAGGTFVFRRSAEAKIRSDGDDIAHRTRIIVNTFALAEVPAILGLIHVLITGQFSFAIVLWGLSIGICILHFPSRAWLEGRYDDRQH